MSRYTLLLLLCLPFVVSGIISALVHFKIHKTSKLKLSYQIFFWLFILIGILSANQAYEWLLGNTLTESEPLSIFDVLQIFAILTLVYIVGRQKNHLDRTEERLNNMHEKLSIQLSEHQKK